MARTVASLSWKLRVVTGTYFLLLTAGVSVSAIMVPVLTSDPFRDSPYLLVGMSGIFIGLGLAATARIGTARIWQALLLFGVLSAGLSEQLYVVAPTVGDASCAVIDVRRGFPISFDYYKDLYISPNGPVCTPPWFGLIPRIVGWFFLLDVLFYVALGLGTVEMSKGTRILIQNWNSNAQVGSSSR